MTPNSLQPRCMRTFGPSPRNPRTKGCVPLKKLHLMCIQCAPLLLTWVFLALISAIEIDYRLPRPTNILSQCKLYQN